MKRYRVFSMVGLALALVISGVTVTATPRSATAADTTPSQGVSIPAQQFTLKNGLRVVLSEDHAAPTVSLCITYDVGSRNELPGPHRLRASL